MTSGGKSERRFEACPIPSQARPLFQATFGNLNRRSPTTLGTPTPGISSTAPSESRLR